MHVVSWVERPHLSFSQVLRVHWPMFHQFWALKHLDTHEVLLDCQMPQGEKVNTSPMTMWNVVKAHGEAHLPKHSMYAIYAYIGVVLGGQCRHIWHTAYMECLGYTESSLPTYPRLPTYWFLEGPVFPMLPHATSY